MSATALDTYDPHTFRALTFHDATLRFREDVILDAMAVIEQRAGRLVDRLWRQV